MVKALKREGWLHILGVQVEAAKEYMEKKGKPIPGTHVAVTSRFIKLSGIGRSFSSSVSNYQGDAIWLPSQQQRASPPRSRNRLLSPARRSRFRPTQPKSEAAEVAALGDKLAAPTGRTILVTQSKEFKFPDGTKVDSFKGVIVAFGAMNAYYEGEF